MVRPKTPSAPISSTISSGISSSFRCHSWAKGTTRSSAKRRNWSRIISWSSSRPVAPKLAAPAASSHQRDEAGAGGVGVAVGDQRRDVGGAEGGELGARRGRGRAGGRSRSATSGCRRRAGRGTRRCRSAGSAARSRRAGRRRRARGPRRRAGAAPRRRSPSRRGRARRPGRPRAPRSRPGRRPRPGPRAGRAPPSTSPAAAATAASQRGSRSGISGVAGAWARAASVIGGSGRLCGAESAVAVALDAREKRRGRQSAGRKKAAEGAGK